MAPPQENVTEEQQVDQQQAQTGSAAEGEHSDQAWFAKVAVLVEKLKSLTGIDDATFSLESLRSLADGATTQITEKTSNAVESVKTFGNAVHLKVRNTTTDQLTKESISQTFKQLIETLQAWFEQLLTTYPGAKSALADISELKNNWQEKMYLNAAAEHLKNIKDTLANLPSQALENERVQSLQASVQEYWSQTQEALANLDSEGRLVRVKTVTEESFKKLGDKIKDAQNCLSQDASEKITGYYRNLQALLEKSKNTIKDGVTNEEGEYDFKSAIASLQKGYTLAKTSGHSKIAELFETTKTATEALVARTKEAGAKSSEFTLEKFKAVLDHFNQLTTAVKNANPSETKDAIRVHLEQAYSYIVNLKFVPEFCGASSELLKNKCVDTLVGYHKSNPGLWAYVTGKADSALPWIQGVGECRVVSYGTEVLKTIDEKVLANKGQNTINNIGEKLNTSKEIVQSEIAASQERVQAKESETETAEAKKEE